MNHYFDYNSSVVWLVVFYGPSTARLFRDGTPIYCPLRRTWSSVLNTVPTGNRIPGRRVAVHYTTAAPRQLLDYNCTSCLEKLLRMCKFLFFWGGGVLSPKTERSGARLECKLPVRKMYLMQEFTSKDMGPVSQKFARTILVYEFVEPVLNYGSNEFVALTNLCETGPWFLS